MQRLWVTMAACIVVQTTAFAGTPRWVGMTAEPSNPSQVSLFNLLTGAKRGSTVATFTMGNPNEHVSPDAFRCRPGGTFCLVLTSNGTDSFLYNVSVVTAPGHVLSITPAYGVTMFNLHVDLYNGNAYTVALKAGSAVVSQFSLGTLTPLVDISAYLGQVGTIGPGGTTQCSDIDVVWVGIRNGTDGTGHVGDVIVQVDLPSRKVVHATALADPLCAALWASCNDATKVNSLGGVGTLAGGAVGYGSYSAKGLFVPSSSATVPPHSPAYALTGLLSEPEGYDYFFPVYPAGTNPTAPTVSGFVYFGNFNQNHLAVNAIDYYLTGAAIIH